MPDSRRPRRDDHPPPNTRTQTLRIRTCRTKLRRWTLWIVYVPLDKEQRTHRTFGLLSVQKPKIPGLLTLFWPLLVAFTERIFKEDRGIVEAEQAAHDAQGGDRNQEVFPVIRSLRELLAECGTYDDTPVRTGVSTAGMSATGLGTTGTTGIATACSQVCADA